MRNSASWEVQIMCEVMSRDAGSVTGRNILNLREEFIRDPREISSREFRNFYQGAQVPLEEGWKLDILEDMLEERQDRMEAGEDIILLQSYIEILAEV